MKAQRDCPQPAACSLQPAASAVGPPTASSLRPTACFFTDRLGSTRATTVLTYGGGPTTRNYYPFGEEIGGPLQGDASQYKFASTYRDSATGLDYAINRYYASGTGRFLSVDSGRSKLTAPQSFNRYAYAGNDPVNGVDPNGLFCVSVGVSDSGPTEVCVSLGGGGGEEGMIAEASPPTPAPAPGPGGGGPTPLEQWNNLNADCRAGLETALSAKGTDPNAAAQLRLNALARAGGMTGTLAKAAGAHGIDFALVAAIGIRESGFNDVNQPDGKGVGVFQIDLGQHPTVTAAQAHDLVWSADWAANLLATNMATLAAKFPNFTADQLLQATAASYNFDTKNISGNPNTIDVGTTGNNYGSNVMNLMRCFK